MNTGKRSLYIISGGQTGADRAALDAAIDQGAPCGGWVPHDCRAEDGPIDLDRYPLTPLAKGGYRRRTRQNVIDSDGTAIIAFGPPDGGSLRTVKDCVAQSKPHIVIDAARMTDPAQAAALIGQFIESHAIERLNIAGPRASSDERIYDFVYAVIAALLAGGGSPPRRGGR